MRLTVIGSSPAWPNPRGAHSGYLVDSAGERLLLDCGPGVLGRLRADGLLPIGAIAITHLHLDHWGDLVPWVWLVEHGHAARGTALWLPPGGRSELAAFGERFGNATMFEHAFATSEYRPRAAFHAAGLEVEAIPVEHYEIPAFGFRVREEGGAVLAYSGDSGPCPALAEIADGASLFLCEATLESGELDANPRGHLSADEARAASPRAARLLLTHRPVELDAPATGDAVVADGMTVEIS